MSSNFAFLKSTESELHDLATLAEELVHRSPTACLRNLRTFGEVLVQRLVDAQGVSVGGGTQHERLVELKQSGHVPERIATCLHKIRMHGNDAAHENTGTHARAKRQLRNAWTAARWLHRHLHPRAPRPDTFQLPDPAASDNQDRLRDELRGLQERLSSVEADRGGAESEAHVAHLESRIRELEGRAAVSSSSSSVPPSRAPARPSVGRRLMRRMKRAGSGLMRAVAWVGAQIRSLVVGTATLLYRLVAAVVNTIRRVVRWAAVLSLVGTVVLFFPSIYATGVEWLPEDTQQAWPTPTSVTETHQTLFPPETRSAIAQRASDGWRVVRTESAEAAHAVKDAAVAQWDRWRESSSAPTEQRP